MGAGEVGDRSGVCRRRGCWNMGHQRRRVAGGGKEKFWEVDSWGGGRSRGSRRWGQGRLAAKAGDAGGRAAGPGDAGDGSAEAGSADGGAAAVLGESGFGEKEKITDKWVP
jgi:hypothetical protein